MKIVQRVFTGILLLVVYLWSTGPVNSQHFSVKKKKDGILLATGAGLLTTALIIEHNTPRLTGEEIGELPEVNRLDAFFNPSTPKSNFHLASEIMIYSEIASVVAIHGLLTPKDERKELLIMTLEGYLLNQGIIDLLKLAVKRPRPFVKTYPTLYDSYKVDARLSFPSGHTANAAYFSVLLASTLTSLDMLDQRVAIPLAIILPVTMGYLRIKAGKHYFSDVLTGAVIGTGLGLLIPRIHQTEFQLKESRSSVSFFENGRVGVFVGF